MSDGGWGKNADADDRDATPSAYPSPWAVAGHELRGPIAAIAALADHVLDGDLSDEQRKDIAALATTAKQLVRLTDRLLDAAAGVPASCRDPKLLDQVDLTRLAGRISRVQRARAKQAGLGYVTRFNIPDDLPIRIDSVALGQTIGNLMDNALKYTAEGEVRLLIDAEPAAGGHDMVIRIAVEDTGPGIPEAVRPFLFQLSERPVHDASVHGAGIGLRIVKRKVAALGGTIRVEDAPGGGARFVVGLVCPLWRDSDAAEAGATTPQAESAATPMPAPSGGRHTVLVVDDNKTNRYLLNAILDKLGYRVLEAESGHAALTIAAGETIDAVLMDLEMPGLDGVDAARHLRDAHGAGLTILSVSAHRGGRRPETDMAVFDGFLEKPVSVAALHMALGRALADKDGRLAG